MEQFRDFDNVCLSGGADGADMEWGRCAGQLGHKVVHWSFPGHESRASADELVRLSDAQLEVGIDAIQSAARALGKSPPRKPHVARLIRRNYYQVAWSTSCYAVTVIKDDAIPGGTAWATTMFAQLHPGNHNLWVFDQDRDAWLQYNGESWDRIEIPPRPTGVWAGIGSRDLKSNGKEAIRKLMMGCATSVRE